MGRRLDEILGFLSRIESHLQAVIADVQIRTRFLNWYAALFQAARQCEAGPIEVESLGGRQHLYFQWPTWQRSLVDTLHRLGSNISTKITLRQQIQCTDAIACLGLVYRLNALSSYILERNAYPAAHRSLCLSKTRSYDRMPHFWVGREFPPANGFAYMVYALALMCSRELYENHADFNAIKVCREVD